MVTWRVVPYPHFPRYDNTHPGRHNMSVWPYIQGVWAYAMVTVGNEAQFRAETERMAYLVTSPKATTDRQFYEIYNFQTGLYDGGWQTGGSWGSAHNQTWSATAFLRAIYEGLFGMRFTPSGLGFAPVLPVGWGDASLLGVAYRGMSLNIRLTGAGNSISSFKLDGQLTTPPQIPGNRTGTHDVDILLTNAFSNVALDAVATSSATPAQSPGAAGVNDGKINGFLDDANPSADFKAGGPASGLNLGDERRSEWVSSSDNKTSAWVQLDWPTPQSVQAVRLFDRINATDQITSGTLSFSDGRRRDFGDGRPTRRRQRCKRRWRRSGEQRRRGERRDAGAGAGGGKSDGDVDRPAAGARTSNGSGCAVAGAPSPTKGRWLMLLSLGALMARRRRLSKRRAHAPHLGA